MKSLFQMTRHLYTDFRKDFHTHHHQVSSALSRLNVMDLHFSLFSALSYTILYSLSLTSPQYCPSTLFLVFPFLFSHQFLLLVTVFCMLFGLLIKCPKYSHFLFLMIFINFRLVFIILSTSSLGLCSFQDILNIRLICPHFKSINSFS